MELKGPDWTLEEYAPSPGGPYLQTNDNLIVEIHRCPVPSEPIIVKKTVGQIIDQARKLSRDDFSTFLQTIKSSLEPIHDWSDVQASLPPINSQLIGVPIEIQSVRHLNYVLKKKFPSKPTGWDYSTWMWNPNSLRISRRRASLYSPELIKLRSNARIAVHNFLSLCREYDIPRGYEVPHNAPIYHRWKQLLDCFNQNKAELSAFRGLTHPGTPGPVGLPKN